MNGHEIGEYTEDCRARGYHYYEPEIELGFGPHVFPPALDEPDDCFVCHGGWSGRGAGGRVSLRAEVELMWALSTAWSRKYRESLHEALLTAPSRVNAVLKLFKACRRGLVCLRLCATWEKLLSSRGFGYK